MTQSRTAKVLALSLGQVLTQALGIISGVVVVRMLLKEDLATYRQTFLSYHFVAPMLSLALPQALYYFLPKRPGQERQTLLANLLLLGIMGAVFTVGLLAGGADLLAWRFNNPELSKTLRYMAPFAMFALPESALGACLVSRGKVTLLAVYNVVSRALLVLLVVVACIVFTTPEALVLVNVGVTMLMLGVALRLMFRAYPGEFKLPEVGFFKEMLKFSLTLGLAIILGTMTLQLSNVIVSSMCSPEQFAVYSIGAVELPLVGIMTGSITAVLLADMAKLCQSGDKTEALRLFQMGAIRSASILFPTTVFFFIAAVPFIEGLYGSKYADSVLPFRLYLLILPMRVVVYGAALIALNKTKLILYRSLLDLTFCALLSVIFVRWFGYIGAAVGMLTTLYLWTVVFNLHAIARGFSVSFWRTLPVARLGRILGLLLAICPLALVFRLVPDWPKLGQLALAGAVFWPVALYVLHREGCLPARELLQLAIRRFRPDSA